MCWAYCCVGHSFEATSPFTAAPLPDAYEFRHTSLQIKSSICRMLAAGRTAVDGRYLPSCCLQNTAAVDFLQTDCERHSALFHCYYSHTEVLEACFRCLHVMWYDVIKCRYSQSSRRKQKLGCWIAPRCTINLSKIELARVFRTKGRYGSPRMMQDVGRRTLSPILVRRAYGALPVNKRETHDLLQLWLDVQLYPVIFIYSMSVYGCVCADSEKADDGRQEASKSLQSTDRQCRHAPSGQSLSHPFVVLQSSSVVIVSSRLPYSRCSLRSRLTSLLLAPEIVH